MKFLIPLVFLVAMASPVKAEGNCGSLAEYYLEYAKPENATGKDYFDVGFYMGYVIGNSDGFRGSDLVSFPQGVTMGQLFHVVGIWLRANPQHWHEPRWWCVQKAFIETWPAN